MALEWSGAFAKPRMRDDVPEIAINTEDTATGIKQSEYYKKAKMLPILIYLVALSGVNCEPETVRDNFDYFSYGNSDDLLKSLDLHMVGTTE